MRPVTLAAVLALGLSAASGCRYGFDATSETLYLEAETGIMAAPFTAVDDDAASGGRYLLDDDARTGVVTSGRAEYRFDVAVAGSFEIWARARAIDSSNDSFLVAVDGGVPVDYDLTASYGPTWEWCDGVRDLGEPPRYQLSAGPHVIELTSREARSQLDLLSISSAPEFVPGP